ncbi:hypothetical protein GZ77_22840 [Endozoicomonas montiporae]|uniref:transketolase n=1 Tax=Endozoicomonas montiporae TaxID=1027273 RepID=A0A081N0H2_9GAMM|nr:transketolase C-terminal domain-containing protein [Endozoicomonas montiporae]KEQ11945.1 hypothetical protein GZ77_22840 [Endozoicomonas montiporae]
MLLVYEISGLVHQDRNEQQLADIARGAYILKDCEGTPELILLATGSEVSLAVDAAAKLTAQGRKVRVVSMPSPEVFEKQNTQYRQHVLPAEVKARVAVEALIEDYWYKYVGLDGAVVGMKGFGESAPAGELFKLFGFTVENIVKTAEAIL